jgi:hypothetical protein
VLSCQTSQEANKENGKNIVAMLHTDSSWLVLNQNFQTKEQLKHHGIKHRMSAKI